MTSIDYTELSTKVREALHASFTDLIAANPDRSFYTFAIWTDDSLQFATQHPGARCIHVWYGDQEKQHDSEFVDVATSAGAAAGSPGGSAA